MDYRDNLHPASRRVNIARRFRVNFECRLTELGDAALQILVPSGRVFGPEDGIVAKLGLSLPLEAPVGRIADLWRVAGRSPPPRTRPFMGGRVARWYR